MASRSDTAMDPIINKLDSKRPREDMIMSHVVDSIKSSTVMGHAATGGVYRQPSVCFNFSFPVLSSSGSAAAHFPPKCVRRAAELGASRPAAGRQQSAPPQWTSSTGTQEVRASVNARRSFAFSGGTANPVVDHLLCDASALSCEASEELACMLCRDAAVLSDDSTVVVSVPDRGQTKAKGPLPQWPSNSDDNNIACAVGDRDHAEPVAASSGGSAEGNPRWTTLASSMVGLFRLTQSLERAIADEEAARPRGPVGAARKGVRTRAQHQEDAGGYSMDSAVGVGWSEVHSVWLHVLTHWPLPVLSLGYAEWWLRQRMWETLAAVPEAVSPPAVPRTTSAPLAPAMATAVVEVHNALLDLLKQLSWTEHDRTAHNGHNLDTVAAQSPLAPVPAVASPHSGGAAVPWCTRPATPLAAASSPLLPPSADSSFPMRAFRRGIEGGASPQVDTTTTTTAGIQQRAMPPRTSSMVTVVPLACALIHTLYGLYTRPPPLLRSHLQVSVEPRCLLLFTLCRFGNAIPITMLEMESCHGGVVPCVSSLEQQLDASTLLLTMSASLSLSSLVAASLAGASLDMRTDLTRYVGRLMRLRRAMTKVDVAADGQVPLKSAVEFDNECARLLALIPLAQ